MPDERQDSIRQGIHTPDESPEEQQAAERKREQNDDAPEIGGAMGGTSDVDAPADESIRKAREHAQEE